jgi:cell fate regulator YaaT (PSP1 superfamily)
LEFVRKHEKLEKEAFDVCQQRIEERSLLMKLVGVEFIFDGSKAIFYFTANKRVDFRELIRDLAHRFRIRIEMRQIGVRDEARMFGGFGVCGRNLCCNSFLCEFQPVTVSMAKEQNLTLDPAKISGICGRLMCCLTFELDCPEKFKRKSKSAEKVSSPGASNAKTMGFSIDSKTIKEGKEEVITVPNLSECSSLCGKEGKKAGE